MGKPNFFIVGAAKSGTTSLYYYLKEHPQIQMSALKETLYYALKDMAPHSLELDSFSKNLLKDQMKKGIIETEEYLNLFNSNNALAFGEASPVYLYDPSVPQKIKEDCPAAKIIIILRNPYDATYSHYLMMKKRNSVRSQSFIETLQSEDIGEFNIWQRPNFIRYRFYDEQVERYLKTFGPDHVKVIRYRELEDSLKVTQSIYSFLGVDSKFRPNTQLKYNVGNAEENRSLLESIVNYLPISVRKSLLRLKNSIVPGLSLEKNKAVNNTDYSITKCPEEAKEFLQPIFEPRIKNLEKILGWELEEWR